MVSNKRNAKVQNQESKRDDKTNNNNNLSEGETEYLSLLYYNVVRGVGALRGPLQLFNAVKSERQLRPTKLKSKITFAKVKHFLSSQPVYTRWKQSRQIKKNERNKIQALFPGHIFEFDVMFLDVDNLTESWSNILETSKESHTSNAKEPILIGVDVFSRFIFCAVLSGVTGTAISDGLSMIFKAFKYVPKTAFADAAGPHKSQPFRAFFKKRNIHFYTTNSSLHAPHCERAIRTIKIALRRWASSHNSKHWKEAISHIIRGYNETVSISTHKLRPVDVLTKKSAAWKAYETLYLKKKPDGKRIKSKRRNQNNRNSLPKVGDYVRILRIRQPFEKESGEYGIWSRAVYKVARINATMTKPLFHLISLDGKPISGGFYSTEVQKIKFDPNALFEISKILGEKKVRGETFVKVSFAGYTGQEWIKKSCIEKVPRDTLISDLE